MTPELGIIEGCFGRSWSWSDRTKVVDVLAPAGYRFFHYAPKNDAKLRRNWHQLHDSPETRFLEKFSSHCRNANVRFGIGLTPYAAHLDFDHSAKAALARKMEHLNAIGIDDLVIMFDDMRGDFDDLAQRQAEIIAFAIERSHASRFFTCPSYYSDDPVLDRIFGRRPQRYLETLGKLLDPAVSVYWTGEEVCSREFGLGHLAAVTDRLGRKPSIWDNYPVNDGPRMSGHLHLRAFTGRPKEMKKYIKHHAINPASQPILGCVPALTLPRLYSEGDGYCYGNAFDEAAATVCGPELARLLREDLSLLQDWGLRGTPQNIDDLRRKYFSIDHPAANEIVEWLNGDYAVTGEMLQTQ